jgi:hypothetical protein
MESPLSVRIQGKLHSTVRPTSGEASFSLYYVKHAQDLQGLSRAQSARAGHRHSQSAPLPCPARTGPAGTLPCPARPCWPPSQPVIHYVRFCRAGPGRPSVTDPTDRRSEIIYKIDLSIAKLWGIGFQFCAVATLG